VDNSVKQSAPVVCLQLTAPVFLVTSFKYHSRGLPTGLFPDIAPSRMFTTTHQPRVIQQQKEWLATIPHGKLPTNQKIGGGGGGRGEEKEREEKKIKEEEEKEEEKGKEEKKEKKNEMEEKENEKKKEKKKKDKEKKTKDKKNMKKKDKKGK